MDGLGIGPLLVFVGFLTENIFEYFIREMLVPTLRPGIVVAMDHLPIHHTLAVIEAIEAAGARVLFTPRYSPDMNPIEEAWSAMKEYMRGIAPRTTHQLDEAIVETADLITPTHVQNFLNHTLSQEQ